MNNIDRLFGHGGASEVSSNPTRAASETSKGGESAAAPARRRGDQVSLSPQARELAEARKAVDEAPDVRSDRVAAIKQQVDDGSYDVSDRALAQALLDNMRGDQGRV